MPQLGMKTIFYVGTIYRTSFSHPKYGKFNIDLETGAVTMPVEYADLLLSTSPELFKETDDNKPAPGADYDKMEWGKLKKYAEERGLETKGVKRTAIISKLVQLDEENK